MLDAHTFPSLRFNRKGLVEPKHDLFQNLIELVCCLNPGGHLRRRAVMPM